MPVPVGKMKITCSSCGWSRTVLKQGDVLFAPKRCGDCDSEQLLLSPVGLAERLNPVTLIQNMLKK